MSRGRVLLVGAGPGDPDLLTVRAVRALGSATMVLHDRLADRRILELVPAPARLIDVGKRPGEDRRQGQILEMMAAAALEGEVVVRLKGGDPMIFGRGGEEWLYLVERGIPVELVPGISSAIAVPALAGIPLTHRSVASSFSVLAGEGSYRGSRDWRALNAIDTLAVLMGVANRSHTARRLMEAGRPGDEPVAFIERGTTPEERVVVASLGEVAAGLVEVEAPAVWVIGRVVEVGRRLARARSTWRVGDPTQVPSI
jgi:uroporphyrin-III C-methyltransferase